MALGLFKPVLTKVLLVCLLKLMTLMTLFAESIMYRRFEMGSTAKLCGTESGNSTGIMNHQVFFKDEIQCSLLSKSTSYTCKSSLTQNS